MALSEIVAYLSLITQPPFVTSAVVAESSLLSGACGGAFTAGAAPPPAAREGLPGLCPLAGSWGGQAVLQAGVAELVSGPDRTQDAAAAGVSPSAQPPVSGKVIVAAEPSSHTSSAVEGTVVSRTKTWCCR